MRTDNFYALYPWSTHTLSRKNVRFNWIDDSTEIMIINLALCQTANNETSTNKITNYKGIEKPQTIQLFCTLATDSPKKSMWNIIGMSLAYVYLKIRNSVLYLISIWFCFCFVLLGVAFLSFFFLRSVHVCVSRPIFTNWCSVRSTLMLAEKEHLTSLLLLLPLWLSSILLPSSGELSHATHSENHTHLHRHTDTNWLTKNQKKKTTENIVCDLVFVERVYCSVGCKLTKILPLSTEWCISMRSHSIWECSFERETTVGRFE